MIKKKVTLKIISLKFLILKQYLWERILLIFVSNDKISSAENFIKKILKSISSIYLDEDKAIHSLYKTYKNIISILICIYKSCIFC